MSSRLAHPRGVRVIAAFKLFHGVLLMAVGFGALRLVHRDLGAEAVRWIDALRLDPANHYIRRALAWLSGLDEKRLRELSVGTFFYSAVLLTEGVGLWLRQRWAEYFSILATSSFIPLEIYEILRRHSPPRITLLLLNVAVVAYLIFDLRSHPENEG